MLVPSSNFNTTTRMASLAWGQGLSATRVERSYLPFDWPVYDGWRLFSDDVLVIEDLRPYRPLWLPLFDR